MCIGPYAQSNTLCGHVVFVAGQIPLDAATMTVWRPLVGGRRHEVAAQLALSLQHALNVLGVQNSAVGKAVGVTVYVNAGAVAELVEDLAWIGQCCCELLDALASNKALGSSHSSSRGDSDSDEDSNDDDEGDEEGEKKAAAVRRAWPVLVVGVGGIPRDCLVEVELLALTHLTRSASLLRATSTVSEAVSSVDAAHDAALLPRIEEWPLWSPRGATTANEPAAAASASAASASAASAAESGSIVKIATSSATWPRCLSSAMCHAGSASADASASSLAAALVREMRRLVSAAGLAPSSLRWVRVYYPEAVWTREHVVAAVSTALEAFVPQFPICFVPALGAVVGSSEERATPSSTLALHFCVLSLLQMRTEAWLAKAGR
jgi:enamine deaminase RidA (YjgF/YER057c/UK114 family)